MLKRVIYPSLVCLLVLPLSACSSGGEGDNFTFGSFSTGATFSTTQTTTMGEEMDTGETGDGDGDPTTSGDGDGDPTTSGDGDGDPTTTTTTSGDGDGDTNCPPGMFGCPCDNGQCDPGLTCDPNDECTLGGGDGDGDPTTSTTGNGNDPWDPAMCVDPSIPVSITGLTGELCSAPCTVDADCPAGPVGTTPACALVLDMAMDPSNCALICDPLNDACSPGSSCKEVPNQPGVGICTYP